MPLPSTSRETVTLNDLRAHFTHTERTLYVNHAATGPLSRPVMEAVSAYLDERYRTNVENFEAFQPIVKGAKRKVARLLGTGPKRVEFVPNTSSGLSILAEGLDWKAGDRVAVPACEFPANVYPFMNLERKGVIVDFIPHEEGTFVLEDIERTLRPETRLLSVSWVQFLSGFRADLEAISQLCQAEGVIFCVDAIQGLGAFRLDVEEAGIDFLASGAHKWLLGTQGLGFIYCSETLRERITPPTGWLHGPVDWENIYDYELSFHPDARRFRTGTMNHVGIAALNAALGLYFEAGPAWCEAQVLARARQLAEGLEAQGLRRYGTDDPARASGIVTVAPPDPEGLQAHLEARSIEAALRNRKLRFSPTYYNTPDEMERILEAVADFDKSLSAS